ncbi:MAG: hypothetical protein QHH43_05215 [Candidatus Saccharicenans sp.]|jgi:hypothetical protein|nr:hypothetical protein [Candidatus Saccharicenans sp.]MDH7575142.1 hypothetical protein [Candidatus Saccharicenans sp.]
MIDSLLPSRIQQTRVKIREMASRFEESHGSGWPGVRPGLEPADIGPLLERLSSLAESLKPGHKKSVELLWLVEELAAGFPKTALKEVVWWALIIPVLKKAGLARTRIETLRVARTTTEKPVLAYNHFFLPPPASRTLKLLATSLSGRPDIEEHSGRYLPVFDLPADKRILIPAPARAENGPGPGVVYYLVAGEKLNFEPCPVVKWYFPFRPAMCRRAGEAVLAWKIEPILTLTAEEFEAGLKSYFLLLSAVFSGWARAGWLGLVRRKQAGSLSQELDAEISFLATEIGRLQHGLLHFSQSRSIPGDYHSRKVEKLCLLGLHLASRAWRHWPARVG